MRQKRRQIIDGGIIYVDRAHAEGIETSTSLKDNPR
jgi:hypothetical protein